MNKTLLVILGILGILVFFGISKYNGLIKQDETVKKAWADVQTQYQRRADVLVNMMETVKGAAKNEKDILTEVTKARAGITDAKSEMGSATTPAQLEAALQKAQTAALNFKVTVEAYPNITSTEPFLKFQDEIAGTENRISTVRTDYNNTIKDYNISVRTFPSNIFAGMLGFSVKEEFKAKESAQDAPEIKF